MFHAQFETRETLGTAGKEIQEVPLRHERNEFAVCRQPRKIGDRHGLIVNDTAKLGQSLMRLLEEFVQQTEFVHQLQRGRMNSVAAEIAQEIGGFFQYEVPHARACVKKAKLQSGRAAAHY